MDILLVEDNETLAKGLIYSLEQSGFNIKHTLNIKDTISYLVDNKPNLIILDISLPDGNGFDLYSNKIAQTNVPTIFLTAKDDENDIVKGLELGADDYITKPFSTKELIARINKIVLKDNKNLKIKVQDIEFDLDKMAVYKNGQEVILTSLELKILNLLFTNINKVVKRDYIIEKVWEWTGNDINDNTVTVYLKRIREKLGSNIIRTIKGIGYLVEQ
jgi:DNA-binding response OmpR family regulator